MKTFDIILCAISVILFFGGFYYLIDYRYDKLENSLEETITITVLKKEIRDNWYFHITDTDGNEYTSFSENKPIDAWHDMYFKFKEGEQITMVIKRLQDEPQLPQVNPKIVRVV